MRLQVPNRITKNDSNFAADSFFCRRRCCRRRRCRRRRQRRQRRHRLIPPATSTRRSTQNVVIATFSSVIVDR